MTKMLCPISALVIARAGMSNEDRMANPLSVDDATRFVLESGDKTCVFFGLNRLMNIAFNLWLTDKAGAKALWTDIGKHMQTVESADPALLGFRTLLRYALADVDKDLATWARIEATKRDPARPKEAPVTAAPAANNVIELVQPEAEPTTPEVKKPRTSKKAEKTKKAA